MIDFESELIETLEEPEEKYSVNRELNLAWELIEDTGANVFLTGRAGTGKTTFLKKLREDSLKNMIVLAPTGVAAINANGTTIHSFFQFPLSPYIPGKGFVAEDKNFLNISKAKKSLISSLSLIVIDEISMVRPDILDAMDAMLRRLRRNSLPFGGVQFLLIGDLRQLPPVVREEEWELLKPFYSSPYFFESHALKKAGYHTVELSLVYRQKDEAFLDILNKIRDGKADQSTLNLLNQRYRSDATQTEMEGYIRLTTHNHRASRINQMRLNAISKREYSYQAVVKDNFPDSAFPVDRILNLKEGSQVMFVKNDIGEERRFYNGMLGKVVSLSKEKIMVKPLGEDTVIDVPLMEWENFQYKQDETTGAITQEKIGSFTQFPLMTAWAITIHKSQGLTFDKAIIDASNSFAPGQTYVALSRCRSLEGLVLESKIPINAVIVDREIDAFVSYCNSNMPEAGLISSLKDNYKSTLLFELFDFQPLSNLFNDFSRVVEEYVIPVYPDSENNLKGSRNLIEKDIKDVARKFLSSCNFRELSGESRESNKPIYSRIQNGCRYFIKQLDEVETFIEKIPLEVENKTYAKRLKKVYDNLSDIIFVKKSILEKLSERNFSVKFYLDAKAYSFMRLEQESIVRKRERRRKKGASGQSERRVKGYAMYETLKLFREGKNILQIAEERNRACSTIAGHIRELITENRINIYEVTDAETLRMVKKVVRENPELGFKEQLEVLNSSRSDNPVPSYIFKICRDF